MVKKLWVLPFVFTITLVAGDSVLEENELTGDTQNGYQDEYDYPPLGEALYPAQQEQSAYPMQLIEQEDKVSHVRWRAILPPSQPTKHKAEHVREDLVKKIILSKRLSKDVADSSLLPTIKKLVESHDLTTNQKKKMLDTTTKLLGKLDKGGRKQSISDIVKEKLIERKEGKVKKKVKSGSKKDQDESEKGDLDINQGKDEDDEEEDDEEEEEVEEDEGGEEDEDDEVDKDDKDEDIMPGFFRSRSRTGNVEETHKMNNEDDAHDADDEEDADDDYNEDSADDEDDEDDEDAEYDEEDEDEDEYYEEDDEGDGEDYYEEDYYDGDYSGDINTVDEYYLPDLSETQRLKYETTFLAHYRPYNISCQWSFTDSNFRDVGSNSTRMKRSAGIDPPHMPNVILNQRGDVRDVLEVETARVMEEILRKTHRMMEKLEKDGNPSKDTRNSHLFLASEPILNAPNKNGAIYKKLDTFENNELVHYPEHGNDYSDIEDMPAFIQMEYNDRNTEDTEQKKDNDRDTEDTKQKKDYERDMKETKQMKDYEMDMKETKQKKDYERDTEEIKQNKDYDRRAEDTKQNKQSRESKSSSNSGIIFEKKNKKSLTIYKFE